MGEGLKGGEVERRDVEGRGPAVESKKVGFFAILNGCPLTPEESDGRGK
jgi:hypothetical protein